MSLARTIPRPDRHVMVAQRCSSCAAYPCHCPLEASCQCGGYVVVERAGVMPAVQAHQRTARHARWRATVGL